MRKVRTTGSFFLVLSMLLAGMVSNSAQFIALPLEWDPSPDASTPGRISGYKLYYAPHDIAHLIPGTPMPPSVKAVAVTETRAVAEGLFPGVAYWFGVVAVDSSGLESEFSNIASLEIPGGTDPQPPPTENPPPPSGGGGSGENPSALTNLVGLLPRLDMAINTGSPYPVINLSGALGATFTVQRASSLDETPLWTTVSEIKLANVAPGYTQSSGGALANAFKPAIQTWTDFSAQISGDPKFYRIFMPHGFAVVADEILRGQNYHTRLVAVRMAGLNVEIACYVSEEGAFLHYDNDTFDVRHESSGETIREIAYKLATVLQEDWISASEFFVVDGVKQILATVVAADDPWFDPPLGAEGGVSMPVDF